MPTTSKRNELLKMFMEKGMLSDTVLPIVALMEGKTEEEKEQIAARVIEEYST